MVRVGHGTRRGGCSWGMSRSEPGSCRVQSACRLARCKRPRTARHAQGGRRDTATSAMNLPIACFYKLSWLNNARALEQGMGSDVTLSAPFARAAYLKVGVGEPGKHQGFCGTKRSVPSEARRPQEPREGWHHPREAQGKWNLCTIGVQVGTTCTCACTVGTGERLTPHDSSDSACRTRA